jgi:hypothetical protein
MNKASVFLGGMLVAACIGLSACGGGGDDPPTATPRATTGALMALRPCESTGPGAPPCPASQAAGTH